MKNGHLVQTERDPRRANSGDLDSGSRCRGGVLLHAAFLMQIDGRLRRVVMALPLGQ